MKVSQAKLSALTINYADNKIEYLNELGEVGYICFTSRIALNTVIKGLSSYAIARGNATYECVLIDRIFELEDKCQRQLIETFQFNAQ